MRAKKLYYVITFHTTADAMAMEHFCETNNIRGRLIPVPREISAGCGLAWRMEPEDFDGITYRILIDGEGYREDMVVDMSEAVRNNNEKNMKGSDNKEGVLIAEGFQIEIEQITRLML
jgi:hypothetical protein